MTRPTIRKLARATAATQKRTAADPLQSMPGSPGTVQGVNGDGTADVVYNGAVVPCQLLGDFAPVIGQTVLVLVFGTALWAVGPAATAASAWLGITETVGYASGWSDSGLAGYWPGQYRLIGDMVQLRGAVIGGTGTIFTLPAGYIPAQSMGYATDGDDAAAGLNVHSSGEVAMSFGSASGYLNLTGQVSIS